jgi:outer membrane lipoprotein SlyB
MPDKINKKALKARRQNPLDPTYGMTQSQAKKYAKQEARQLIFTEKGKVKEIRAENTQTDMDRVIGIASGTGKAVGGFIGETGKGVGEGLNAAMPKTAKTLVLGGLLIVGGVVLFGLMNPKETAQIAGNAARAVP